MGAVASSELASGARLALTEHAPDRKILAVEVQRPEQVIAPKILVPQAEVLPVSSFRLFGEEGRLQARPNAGALEIVCAAGQTPGGVVLDIGESHPAASLMLDLQTEADDGFTAQIVKANEEARNRGIEFVSLGDRDKQLKIPVEREGALSLVIACPEAGGRLRLKRVTVRSSVLRPLDRQSAWVWEPEAWANYPDELLEAAVKIGLGRLYISVPSADGEVGHSSALRSFISAAQDRSILVSAVEGDPGMIAGEGRTYALERARALAAYNHSVASQERLDSVQYDIEPYLGPSYAAQKQIIWHLWSQTLEELQAVIGQKIDVVVPYWMLEAHAAKEALEDIASKLDRLTIMAYRTAPSAIISAAAPLLAWSAEHKIEATVALEVGELAPEQRKVFVSAPAGDLHVIRFDDISAVVLLDHVRTGSTSHAYRLSHTVPSDVSRISFDGATETALSTAAAVSHDLAAWASTRNFALHGLPELTVDALSAREKRQ